MARNPDSPTIEQAEQAALDHAEAQTPEGDASLVVFGRDVDSYDGQGTSPQAEDATAQDWAVADAVRPDFQEETVDGLNELEESARASAEDLAMDEPLEERIRRKAYELWESEGGPHGRADDHWHLAAALVAEEDAARSSLLPFDGGLDEPVEEARVTENLGEFQGLADQGAETDRDMTDRINS
ncbi:DUF2934 domain-containing protein [Geminicoccus flavidas]|uniref:DUF2934 domain-containing protein n=1 Tax=Geminicoccus flavidas TaxID=2506407 RepID=UPI001F476E4F|nr:DUF2934 domain-containing protein [Geminicoccus flavidas]